MRLIALAQRVGVVHILVHTHRCNESRPHNEREPNDKTV